MTWRYDILCVLALPIVLLLTLIMLSVVLPISFFVLLVEYAERALNDL